MQRVCERYNTPGSGKVFYTRDSSEEVVGICLLYTSDAADELMNTPINSPKGNPTGAVAQRDERRPLL